MDDKLCMYNIMYCISYYYALDKLLTSPTLAPYKQQAIGEKNPDDTSIYIYPRYVAIITGCNCFLSQLSADKHQPLSAD